MGDTVELAWPEVALLTLQRPEAGNALSTQLTRDLAAAVAEVGGRPPAKALVVTGAGRMFCAGADLKEVPKPEGWLDLLRRTFDQLAAVPVPTVAAVNGACMGGGTELALSCDLRVMAVGARIGLPEISFGAPAAGGPQRLARLVGPARAKYLIMSAARLTADEAAAVGLVDRVVPEGEAAADAGLALARELTVHAGYALRTTKAVIDRGAALPLDAALESETRAIDTMASADERAAERDKAVARSATYGRIFNRGSDRGRTVLDFSFTPAQEELRERVHAFAAEHVAPQYLERARSDDFPADLQAAFAEAGLLGLRYPEAMGGGGLDQVSTGIVLEELAKADMNAALFCFFCLGGRDGGRWPEPFREALAGEIIRGETVTCAGITEPGGGSDVAGTRTTAVRDGDHYVLNGEKTSVGMAAWARYATVVCRVGGEGYRGIGTLFVDLEAPGVERGRIRDMGSGIVGRGWLRFTDVRVPAEHLVLPEGEGFVSTMKGFDVARVQVSMMTLGPAIASLQEACDYARRREVFGKTIAHYQGIAFRLAEDATLVEAMRLMVYRALWLADEGVPHTMESSMCKWWVPLTSQQICHRSLLTFGHYGYDDANPVQQRYRDVVGLEIGDGTAEIQKLVVARRLLGREAGSI